MKKHLRNITTAIAAAAIIGCGVFTSCTKEDTASDTSKNPAAKRDDKIPVYKSGEDIEALLEEILKIDTITELEAYELKNNRASIGRIADTFYEDINPEAFKSKDDALNFFRDHQDVLDTIIENDEVIIMPKLSNTPYRYIANINGMFAIGDTYYRLFKRGTVVTSEKHHPKLLDITDNDLTQLDTSIFRYIPNLTTPSEADNCGTNWTVANDPTSEEDRLHIELITQVPFCHGAMDFISTRVKVYNCHKWLDMWWTSRHSLSCKGTVRLHVAKPNTNDMIILERNVEKHKSANTMWADVYSQLCLWETANSWDKILANYRDFYHYYDFNIKAWYPGHAVETLSK